MQLELLAPAKNKDIGISAIDCGADAVYIAGPAFGAREAASNSFEEIAVLTEYAHRFGARVYMTLNTILYDSELSTAERYIHKAYQSGIDALIVQDLGVLKMKLPPIELHASTQCNIRTPEQARWLESLGFSRLILARELSLEQIKEIRKAVSCELEAFVHGALCVCYSGQCYLSHYLTGRSANRGSCAQACRSNYDLIDSRGNTILRDKPLLSLKDFRLDDHIAQLIEAGIISFKIEGRLKNASYVKNVTSHYRKIIDRHTGGGNNSSLGRPHGGFTPNIDSTFSRGSTSFFIDGVRGQWLSGESAKSIGERIGTISEVRKQGVFRINSIHNLSNGDGLFLVAPNGKSSGVRVDMVSGEWIMCKSDKCIIKGATVYRNFNIKFEKELENNTPTRLIDAKIEVEATQKEIQFRAMSEGGYYAEMTLHPTQSEQFEAAHSPQIALEKIKGQLNKISDNYTFQVSSYKGFIPFLPPSTLNSVRRELAVKLALALKERYIRKSEQVSIPFEMVKSPISPEQIIKLNCSNTLSRELYQSVGVEPAEAFELSKGNPSGEYRELMRTKYCLKHELGMCGKNTGELFLVNNKRKIKLQFDCKRCEMALILLNSQD